MKEKAGRYLNRNRVHFAGMLYALNDANSQLVYAGRDGVMLRFGRLEYVSAASEDAMRAMLPRLRGNRIVALEPIFDEPLFRLGFTRDLLCRSCLYERDKPPKPPPLPRGLEMKRLTHEHGPFILKHYDHADSLDYVHSRLDNGVYGLFENGALAGFGGFHNSGEIGIIETLPAYRRRGYAFRIEARLIGLRLKEGLLPFCDVETHNEASLALQRKLGMTIGKEVCGWYAR